jgi:RNA-binding protein NOB1
MSKAEYLVVDSGGFIKNAPLRTLATNLVTLHDVIDEIRDKPTRQRLQAIPYELEFRQPTSQGLKVVADFAKKTGDYASLSATDLRVLAVTYDLEVEKRGKDHLNSEPVTKRTVEFYKPEKGIPAGDKNIAGFYIPDGGKDASQVRPEENFSAFQFWREPMPDIAVDFDLDILNTGLQVEESSVFSRSELEKLDLFLKERSFILPFEVSPVDFFLVRLLSLSDAAGFCNIERWIKHIQSYPTQDQEQPDQTLSLELIKNKINEGSEFGIEDVSEILEQDEWNQENESSDEGVIMEDDSDKENEDEDDDDEGWITPSNLKEKKASLAGKVAEDSRVEVACITTDFAMQNVLKQIGLNIIGANGMIIKETKTWILRCYACSRTTPLLEKKFCPKCGNKTLKRVSMTLNADGSQQIHISTRRPLSTKGKKFSLPAPKGGKHCFNPKLSEDQRDAQQRLSRKAIQKNNPMDPDYIAGNSPFLTKDVTSKSAILGLKGAEMGQAKPTGVYWTKKNPNAGSKNTGNKRKK